MKSRAVALLIAVLLCEGASAASQPTHAAPRAAWGTSAAVDRDHRLWIAWREPVGANAHVVLAHSEDGGASWQPPVRVTATPEAVSADGENRPKLAFGPQGDIYVSWTSPTSAQYTADIHFARSLDGGRTWSAPVAVHRDRQVITHRFESMMVDRAGRIWIAWIDKRDLKIARAADKDYAGAAVYYAWSDSRGASWQGDFKLADHSCECCRIALAMDAQGRPTAMWRHVFGSSERDHAIALLTPSGQAPLVERATFDRWRIDACPHHGPGLAYDRAGVRHAVWFNQVNGQGRMFYGQPGPDAPTHVRELPSGASHADIATAGDTLAIAWKRFDGALTRVESWISRDAGQSFTPGPALHTEGDSDQPRLVSAGENILLVWRRAEGTAVESLRVRAPPPSAKQAGGSRSPAPPPAKVKTFQRTSLTEIERQHRGRPFWLVLWDLECTYCVKSLRNLGEAQRERPDLRVVTVSTDSIAASRELRERLTQLGVVSDAYAFGEEPAEALRFAIDPSWMGEKPRAWRYDARGQRESISGVITAASFAAR